ncbi:MAG TPA: PaaI family thioesterase [Candidatus Dormibacteraeota bacterium]|nr:PaaI family thioesterase [Candidatus Dormibacteraeota bacterium]
MTEDRLAGAIRELVEQVANGTAAAEALADAASAIELATRRLREAGGRRALSYEIDGERPDRSEYRRHNPVSGERNPLAPPLRYDTVGEGTVEATVTFGVAYQGPPGYVHGAFIAGVFDDALGLANLAGGHPGMTVKLEVRYRRPTPLRTPLRVLARHTSRDGRRIFASAEMLAGDEVTAEAEGVFAEITAERAAALFAQLDARRERG